MSITKKLLPLSLVASLLLFSACGGGGKNTPSQNTDEKDKVTVPQKISIDIPDSLKSNRATGSTNKLLKADASSVQSFGYQQLTSTISQAEDTIKSVKDNMKYLALMMPDIVNACQDIPKNETCHIDAGTIKLNIEGKTLSMGKIAYTQQDNNKTYQEIIILDLKPTLKSMGESVTKDLETVKWSTDEKHIETLSDVKVQDNTYTMQLRYDKANDDSSKMLVTDNFSDTIGKGNFTLKLEKKNDTNNTVNVETTGNIHYGEESDTFSAKGTVDNNGGFLISKGSYMGESYAEKETFSTTGKLLQTTFCHNNDNCQISDTSSWIKFDDAEGIVDQFDDNSTFDNDFNPIELTFTNSENFPEFTYCEILPSNYNTSSLKEDDIYMNSIGSFARFDDELFGTLLITTEKNSINTLPIVCNNSESTEFSLILENTRPTIGFKE